MLPETSRLGCLRLAGEHQCLRLQLRLLLALRWQAVPPVTPDVPLPSASWCAPANSSRCVTSPILYAAGPTCQPDDSKARLSGDAALQQPCVKTYNTEAGTGPACTPSYRAERLLAGIGEVVQRANDANNVRVDQCKGLLIWHRSRIGMHRCRWLLCRLYVLLH
jgi:hypothetical protein